MGLVDNVKREKDSLFFSGRDKDKLIGFVSKELQLLVEEAYFKKSLDKRKFLIVNEGNFPLVVYKLIKYTSGDVDYKRRGIIDFSDDVNGLAIKIIPDKPSYIQKGDREKLYSSIQKHFENKLQD